MIDRVILLVNAPFSERDHKRFGIELLGKRGFQVEIWDLTRWLHPAVSYRLAGPDCRPYDGYQEVATEPAMRDAITRLNGRSFVLCTFAYHPERRQVFRVLSQARVPYGLLATNAIPALDVVKDPGLILQRALRSPFKLFRSMVGRVPPAWVGVHPAKVIVAGGEESLGNGRTCLKGRDTEILWAHTLDYDLYLEAKDTPSKSDNSLGVFLDEYLPFHPDFSYRGMSSICQPSRYYPSVCRLFDLVERDHKARIIVAAHPRSQYEDHPDYFGGRPVIRGKTVELVRQAGFIVAHSSTAVNFAVLFNKPVVFITTNEIEQSRMDALFIKITARCLNKIPINVDDSPQPDWKTELIVDKEAYARYRRAYIKTPGSPEKPAWEIVGDYLERTRC